MRSRVICRYDPGIRTLRLLRVTWETGRFGERDARGRAVPYSHKLTVGLKWWPLLQYVQESDGWIATVLGVRVHVRHSAGGRFA